jgi:hypothetical protein
LENSREIIMRKIVDVKTAAKYYLDGKPVRRYITSKMFAEAREEAHATGRRFNDHHTWKGVWLWLDDSGKRCSNVKEQEDEYENETTEHVSWCHSPLDVISKKGFNTDRLWEIEL